MGARGVSDQRGVGMKRLSDLLPAFDGDSHADEKLPCANCKTPMVVSGTTIDFWAAMNRVRAQRNIPLVKKSDGIALCPPCYERHREFLQKKTDIDREHDDELWREWLKKRDASDRATHILLAKVHDKGFIGQLAARVKAKWAAQDEKAGKAANTSKKDDAVFRRKGETK